VIPVLAGMLASAAVASLFVSTSLRVDPRVAVLVGRSRSSTTSGARSAIRRLVDTVGGLRVVRRFARLDRLEGALRAAAWSTPLRDLVATKVAAALGVAMTIAVLRPSLAPLALVAGMGAFVVPDVALSRAAKARVRAADAEVPQFLDLLAAASAGGLAAPAAIARAIAGMRGPLASELEGAVAAVGVGGRWRDELRDIAGRLALSDLEAAVTVVARTETLGASLAESLHDLATEVRDERRARATERARTAPVKMLFPLVFMVLPAFLLLTVVPVLIATLRSLK